MKKFLTILLRITGFLLALGLAGYLLVTRFYIPQVTTFKILFPAFIIVSILLGLLYRSISHFIKKRIQSMDVAREINVNGYTSPMSNVIIRIIFTFSPALLLIGFIYLGSIYNGTLHIHMLQLLGTVLIYYIFDLIAILVERYYNNRYKMLQINKQNADIASRVDKIIETKYNIHE